MPPILRPLALRNVALLWCGLSMSAIGDQLFIVVLGWIAVETFGTNAGFLTALQAGVMLTTASWQGAWPMPCPIAQPWSAPISCAPPSSG